MIYTEISEVLEISVKAVEKRMHLALKTLRTEIKELKKIGFCNQFVLKKYAQIHESKTLTNTSIIKPLRQK